MMEIVK